jgi:Xaa-Pro dipeptidase
VIPWLFSNASGRLEKTVADDPDVRVLGTIPVMTSLECRSTNSCRKKLAGWQLDKAARDVLASAGYSQYLSNREGYSIGTEVHGNGANIDNCESRDEREIIPNTCFSIEPGICLPEFGLRSEVNVLVRRGSAEVTGRIQRELVLI